MGITAALVAGSAISFATGDVGLAVGWGLLVFIVGSLGHVSRRVPFSFGEGFVGYRPDPVWPHGVQEDDDVRWDWQRRQSSDEE